MIKLTTILQEILLATNIASFLNMFKEEVYRECGLEQYVDDNDEPLLGNSSLEFTEEINGKGKKVAIIKNMGIGWEASFNREDIDFGDEADIDSYNIKGKIIWVATFNVWLN